MSIPVSQTCCAILNRIALFIASILICIALRHFMIDHVSDLTRLGQEVDLRASVVFARMTVSHPDAYRHAIGVAVAR